MEVDYIVVGTGIAGVSLALELQAKGQRIAMFDSGEKNTSSKIAAGIVNPIVPKRVTKTWMADEVFPTIENYYKHWEKILETSFYYPLEMIQIHATAQDSNAWSTKYESLQPFLQESEVQLPEFIQTPFGSSSVKFCGRLDVAKFCEAGIAYLLKTQNLFAKYFKYNELRKGEDGIFEYQTVRAKNIIFCEGINALNNPWFSYLPFIPSGGDIVTIKIPGMMGEKRMFKQSTWLVPLEGDLFLAGSTFHQNSLDTTPNKTDAAELVKKIKKWLNKDVALIQHQKAIRPTVKDRRPFLGEHPAEKGLFIYNGLGTKGSSLNVWLAPTMARFLVDESELPDEVNIQKLKF